MALIGSRYPRRLLTLGCFVGVLAILAPAWNLGAAIGDRLRAEHDLERATENNALFELTYAIGQEDMAVFQSLTGESPHLSPEKAARRTDAAIALTQTHLAAHHEGGHDVALTLLAAAHQGLMDRRWDSRAALKGPEGNRQAALRRWRAFMDAVHVDLETLQHDLMREAGPPEQRGDGTSALRHYTLFAFEKVLANRFEIERAAEAGTVSSDAALGLMASAASLRGALELVKDQFLSEPESAAAGQLEAATSFLLDEYLTAEGEMLSMLSVQTAQPIHLEPWRKASRFGFTALIEADKALAREASTALQTLIRQSNAAMAVWFALLCTAVALVFATLVAAWRDGSVSLKEQGTGSQRGTAEASPV